MQALMTILVALLVVLTSAGCSPTAFSSPPSRDQLKLVTVYGTLKTGAEARSWGERYLDFYLMERPQRFRVAVEDAKRMDMKQVRQILRAGTPVAFTVEQRYLDKPLEPPSDHIPTVFIYELKSGDTVLLAGK